MNQKIANILPVIAERYGICETIDLEKCYENLLLQAQWVNLAFVSGKGQKKTQLQKDIETLAEYMNKRN